MIVHASHANSQFESIALRQSDAERGRSGELAPCPAGDRGMHFFHQLAVDVDQGGTPDCVEGEELARKLGWHFNRAPIPGNAAIVEITDLAPRLASRCILPFRI